MTDRPFTHPNAGKQIRVEQNACEVRLVFVCDTQAMSDSLCKDLLRQLKVGALNLTLMGKPTSIEES